MRVDFLVSFLLLILLWVNVQVEIWDLNNAERVMQLPQNCSDGSPNISTKERGILLIYEIFHRKLLRGII